MFIFQTNSLCIHPLGQLPASPAAVTLLPPPPPPATLLQLGCFLLSMFFAFNCKIAFLLQTTRRMRNAQRAKTGSKTCGWSNKLPQLAAPSTKSLIPVAALMCLNHYKLLNRGEDLPLYRSLPLSAPSSLDHSLRPCWERQKCNLNLVL